MNDVFEYFFLVQLRNIFGNASEMDEDTCAR